MFPSVCQDVHARCPRRHVQLNVPVQGLEDNSQRHMNSPVMYDAFPARHKPSDAPDSTIWIRNIVLRGTWPVAVSLGRWSLHRRPIAHTSWSGHSQRWTLVILKSSPWQMVSQHLQSLWKPLVVVVSNNLQEVITASSSPPCFCCARYTCEELEGMKVENKPQKIFSSPPRRPTRRRTNGA